LVEIPASFQAIKASSMRLAQEWRQQTRMIFETYFQAGYLATDFLSEQMGEARRNFYLLSRSE
jgi:predicted GNAT superfamily acetyltransferase